jgi:hypothetical protein
VIDDYLRELRRRLPPALGFRRRAPAEAREHLHDAAAGASDEDAVGAFGNLDDFAARLRE